MPGPLPPSAIASPEPEATPIAPLSQPVPTDVLSGGGTVVRPDAVTSPTAGSASPSQAQPSIAGGGGNSLQDCMGFWDKATHMSKAEWRASCIRSMAENPDVKW
jgi:hypothetical protein